MKDPAPESLLPLQTAVFHILIALADRDCHGSPSCRTLERERTARFN